MRLLLTWLLRGIGVLGVVGALGASLGYYLLQRSLPDFNELVIAEGLEAEVRITRDRWAIPHIRAENAQDAFFALGVVHAQDRLWQMELNRRAAQGRLSALLGPRTTQLDRLVKTLDIYGHATRSLPFQSAETQAALEAYAEGVNAWMRHLFREAKGRGAPEFFFFGGEGLAPWTPADSLGVLKMMALRLSASARIEIRRARFLLTLPPERVADILPDAPEGKRIEIPRFAELFDAPFPIPTEHQPQDPILAILGPVEQPSLAGASNAWAVDGSRSASRRPLLAADPHLSLSAPSIWYLADVQGGEVAAMGGTLPGTPLVLIGRNRDIAWGLTTATADDQDVFIERLDPEDPGRYRTPDGWARFEERQIRIDRDGADPVIETVRRSRNGPVLDSGLFGAEAVTPEGHVAALRWTALEDEDRTFSAAFAMMSAPDVETALARAAGARAPAQNVMVADRQDIGIVLAGALPARRADSPTAGRVPSPGWLTETAWEGIRPAAENPRILRPRSGALANANNRVTDRAFPEHISFDFDLPYRIQRIEKELKAREWHSLKGFLALQTDAVSEMARAILPLIARDLWWRESREATAPAGPKTRRATALELLAAWNGSMDRNRPEPLIFAEWLRQLTLRLASDELGPLMPLVEGLQPLFVERAFKDIGGAGIWCDIDKTPERETCAEMAEAALDDAIARLVRDYGPNPEGWRWGAAHRAEHPHTPLGHIGPLKFLVSIRHETSGGDFTIMRGAMQGGGAEPFRNVHASGLRMAVDFADPDRSAVIIATGQSGHPLSRHYDDMAELWARGDTVQMSMDDADARLGAVGEMRLIPLR
ncbi:MAG: penicillin acylase family protein [Pseudomonadota bacterium]